MNRIRRIGVLTGGGDAPGLNAVIRAVVRTADRLGGIETLGVLDGFGAERASFDRPARSDGRREPGACGALPSLPVGRHPGGAARREEEYR